MKLSVNTTDLKKFNAKSVGYNKKVAVKSIEPKTDKDWQAVSENVDLLERCMQYWNSLSDFRDRYKRSRKYYRGEQWHEVIIDPDTGESITEENYIKKKGKVPFKQNMIRPLVKNMIGQYRSIQTKPLVVAANREDSMASDMMNSAIYSVHNINHVKELDARNLEGFLLSGMCIGKVTINYFPEKDKKDVYYENVNPNRIFFNSDITDVRLGDLHIIGEIIDTKVENIVSAFAKNKKQEKEIREHYQDRDEGIETLVSQGLSARIIDSLSFSQASDTSVARVIEVWYKKGKWKLLVHDYMDGSYSMTDMKKEELDAANEDRMRMAVESGMSPEEVPLIEYEEVFDETWHVKYLTPYGWCLFEGETPYAHQEHPYTLLAYPLLDGEVWSFVEDVIDQQRYINRLISLLDFIMGSSAKGVLLVPEESIPAGMNIDDFADEWGKFNGVIKIKTKGGVQLPQQVSANSTNIGAHELLSLQLKLIESISGVNSAIQGQQAKSGTPATLYAQESSNSQINSRDIFETYSFFKRNRDSKMLKAILQFYQDKKPMLSSKSDYSVQVYDPEIVKDVDFDFAITSSMDTPIYRQLIDDTLYKMLERQMIDLETYLEHSSLPYADRLLNTIKQKKADMMASMQQGGMPGMPPDIMGEVQNTRAAADENSNPSTQALINRMIQQNQTPQM